MAEVKFTDNSKEVIEEKNRLVRQFLVDAALHISSEARKALAKDPIRIDTGLLKNSVTYAISGEGAAEQTYKADKGGKGGSYKGKTPEYKKGLGVYIGTNVEYARYVHEGTKRMTPNRFLKTACELNKDQFKQNLKRILGG